MRRPTADDWDCSAGWVVLVCVMAAMVAAALKCYGCRELHVHLHLPCSSPATVIETGQPAPDPPEPEVIIDGGGSAAAVEHESTR